MNDSGGSVSVEFTPEGGDFARAWRALILRNAGIWLLLAILALEVILLALAQRPSAVVLAAFLIAWVYSVLSLRPFIVWRRTALLRRTQRCAWDATGMAWEYFDDDGSSAMASSASWSQFRRVTCWRSVYVFKGPGLGWYFIPRRVFDGDKEGHFRRSVATGVKVNW